MYVTLDPYTVKTALKSNVANPKHPWLRTLMVQLKKKKKGGKKKKKGREGIWSTSPWSRGNKDIVVEVTADVRHGITFFQSTLSRQESTFS